MAILPELALEKFKQNHQASIEFNLKSLNALFFLNGAAATALLAQSSIPLKGQAFVFAFAALWAAYTLGLNHFYYLFANHFAHGDEILNPFSGLESFLLFVPMSVIVRNTELMAWRVRLTRFAFGPIVLFLVGLVWTWLALSSAA